MSARAVAWALDVRRSGRHMTPGARLVLVTLADAADNDGGGAYLAAGTIAARLAMSVRSVRRILSDLEAAGVLHRGNQSKAWHLPSGQRPVVWDLPIDGSQTRLEDDGTLGLEAYRDDPKPLTDVAPLTPVTPLTPEIDPCHLGHPTPDRDDRYPLTEVSPNPTTNPTTNRDLRKEPHQGRPALATASAAMAVPDPHRPVVWDGNPLTRPDCPVCGQLIGSVHRCRGNAGTMPAGYAAAVGALGRRGATRLDEPRVVVDRLDLEHIHPDPCGLCGGTSRPIVAQGMCRPCYFAQNAAGAS